MWTYVRDDRPFGGQSPPPALYYASRDRQQEHPERHLKSFTGILQADAFGGYKLLFKVDRDAVPPPQALCWAHSRRKFSCLPTSPPIPNAERMLPRSTPMASRTSERKISYSRLVHGRPIRRYRRSSYDFEK
ncbi:hypothetical protein GGE07_006515 [Sinorhizobium terangae]|nr:hypothetical protein [Sinorhizobium terangae]